MYIKLAGQIQLAKKKISNYTKRLCLEKYPKCNTDIITQKTYFTIIRTQPSYPLSEIPDQL